MQFIETSVFTKRIAEMLTDDEYHALQETLIQNPKAGLLIPGGKGLRKYRWATSGKGKRGGVRIIYYLYLAEDKIYMLFSYKKSDQGDLTAAQMKRLVDYVQEGVL
jgi:hypothetical protein